MSTINENLAHGHLQNGGELTPTLQFIRELAQELLKIDAVEEEGGGGRSQRSCTKLIPLTCELVAVAYYCGICDSLKKRN